jgi:opacity protein-like surface antigen
VEREIMNRLMKIAACSAAVWGLFLAVPQGVAQGPLVTATGTEIIAHGGFEYIGQQAASGSRVPMYGANSGLTVGFWRKFGVRFDLGYARANNLFGTGHDSDILSYMVGPTFYPVRTERLSPYGELLAGGARVTSVTLNGPDGYIRGYANEFAWAGGGGLEFRASPGFAVRVGADYMHTRYFAPSTALTGQGNIRAVMSFTYHLGVRRR